MPQSQDVPFHGLPHAALEALPHLHREGGCNLLIQMMPHLSERKVSVYYSFYLVLLLNRGLGRGDQAQRGYSIIIDVSLVCRGSVYLFLVSVEWETRDLYRSLKRASWIRED